jgi:hypothetical protein
MVIEQVEELDAADALLAFGDLRATRDRAERDIFVVAAHYADLHHPEAIGRGDQPALPGADRGVRLGGHGTPPVLELTIAEAAAELHTTTFAARRLIGDALDTRHRLPRTWARVLACEVPVRLARTIAQATRDLTTAQAGTVDDTLAEYADGRLPYGRFLDVLDAAVIAADPDAAAERERLKATERFAKVGQSNDHGNKTLYVRTDTAAMTRIDATIAYLAEALKTLGDPDPEDQRRTKAILLMANPHQALTLIQALHTHHASKKNDSNRDGHSGSAPGAEPEDNPLSDHGEDDTSSYQADQDTTRAKPTGADRYLTRFRPGDVPVCPCRGGTYLPDTHDLLPHVTLYVHLHADTITNRGNGVARWEGEGPVTAAYVRDFLGPHARFTIRPVIDPTGLAPVDAYEIPDRHREALHLRSPADIFPFAPNTRRRQQIDHSKPYERDHHGKPAEKGQTGLHNLGKLTTYHHRVKTHTGWTLRQPFPGIYLWRSPHGSIFLVDHTGTRQIRRPERTSRRDAPTTRSLLEQHLALLMTAA